MTSDGTSLYWVEFNRHSVRQAVLATQEVTTMLGTACVPDCPATPPASCNGSYAQGVGAAAAFSNPFDIVFHYPTNSLFIADGGNAVIRRVQ